VIAQGDMRPVKKPGAMDELKALLNIREPLYSQSEIAIDTSHHTEAESVDLIIKRLGHKEPHPPASPVASDSKKKPGASR